MYTVQYPFPPSNFLELIYVEYLSTKRASSQVQSLSLYVHKLVQNPIFCYNKIQTSFLGLKLESLDVKFQIEIVYTGGGGGGGGLGG